MSEENKQGWFSRLTQGLKKSTNRITEGLTAIVTKRKLDEEMLQDIEDVLLSADVGVSATQKLTQQLKKQRFDQEVTLDEVKQTLSENILEILSPLEKELKFQVKPTLIFMVGVNGSGKTTTTGKMAAQWAEQGHKVRLVAADTFRAAAIDQLEVWAARSNVPIEKAEAGSDAAALCYKSYELSKKEKDDILIIDTAGRLHNKSTLMDELAKMNRVVKKIDSDAPHYTLLVLDANIGQNTLQQVKLFQETIPLHGLVITKLDGTSKAGILIQLAETFKLPIFYLGVGESLEDLRTFEAKAFADNLLGVELIKQLQ